MIAVIVTPNSSGSIIPPTSYIEIKELNSEENENQTDPILKENPVSVMLMISGRKNL